MDYRKYTINDFIEEYRTEAITYPKLFYKEIIEKLNGEFMIIQKKNMTLKYEAALKEAIITLTLTDQECNKYFYNPKLLSYDLYGTTELWFLILHANELYSTSQFAKNPLIVYTPNVLTMISSILNLEKSIIDVNEDELSTRTEEIENSNPEE